MIYLERRHALWFRTEHKNIHSRAECQQPMSEDCTLDDFKCCPFWQRKLSNKWNARLLAQKLGIPVPDLYWYGTAEQIDQIPFDKLPSHYVIKPTSAWSCLGVFVMKNGVNLFDQKSYTPETLQVALKKIAKQFPKSRFMIEQMVQNEHGEYGVPIDFKCHLFGKQLESILAIRRKDGHSGWAAFYDHEWNHKGGASPDEPTLHIAPYKAEKLPAPKCLKEMVKYAEKLGKFYGSFVRMDFFATPLGAVFCEVTPFPNAGGNFNAYSEKWLPVWKKLDPKLLESTDISDGQIKLNGVRGMLSSKVQNNNKDKVKKDEPLRNKRIFSPQK